jgi:hypothetical protein
MTWLLLNENLTLNLDSFDSVTIEESRLGNGDSDLVGHRGQESIPFWTSKEYLDIVSVKVALFSLIREGRSVIHPRDIECWIAET